MRNWTHPLFAMLAVALLAALPHVRAADPVVIGYLYGEPEGVDFSLYTHLCHAFVVADGDGNILEGRGGNAPSAELTKAAHAKGVRVLLSLGGWGWDEQFASIVSKPESEDRYVATVLKMVAVFDYDGIDLDWEYPDKAEELPGFERLVRRLRAGIDAIGKNTGKPMFLTMAVSADPGTVRWLRPEFVVENFDWLNVMTYDMAGPWTDYAGHNAPMFPSTRQPEGGPLSVTTTMNFLLDEHKIPADRLTLGIPLFGRGFAVDTPYASTKGVAEGRPPGGDYRDLKKLLDSKDWTRRWDEETKVPWLVARDGSAVIGYDDQESVAIKARWAREKGLRGVFFWEIAADRLPDRVHPLQRAARGALFD